MNYKDMFFGDFQATSSTFQVRNGGEGLICRRQIDHRSIRQILIESRRRHIWRAFRGRPNAWTSASLILQGHELQIMLLEDQEAPS